MMNLPQVCYSTNTTEDKKRLEILSKKLLKSFDSETKVLEALIATGLANDRLAAHWLANHSDDPTLTAGHPRQYYLLLCPVNDLENSYQDFWTGYRTSREWCCEMEFVPSVRLVQPFEATASNAMQVYHAFNNISRFYAERCISSDLRPALATCSPADTQLRFVLDNCSTVMALAEAAEQFAEQLCGYTLAPVVANKPPFTMGLCSEFHQAQQPLILKELREKFRLDEAKRPNCPETQWQLRLYSRDIRLLDGIQDLLWPIYKVQGECIEPENDEQLCYTSGDRIALFGRPTCPRHAWGRGFNSETGLVGNFRLTGATRIPASSTWTLHKVANVSASLPKSPAGDELGSQYWSTFSRQSSACTDDSGCCQVQHQPRIAPSDTSGESSDSVAMSPKPVSKSSSFTTFFSERPRRQLHIVRHGERLDLTVGFTWTARAFDQRGVFVNRYDLNIPEHLPTRPVDHFNHDSPLTVIGQFVSYQMGESLFKSGVRYTHCFCSPALRCVQTAHFMLTGSGQQQLQIRIEPMLYEFMYDNNVQMPNFVPPQQLQAAGYNVDRAYKPLTSLKNMDRNNTREKYLARLDKVFKKIIDATKKKGGKILIVGHRTTLEMCPQVLLDRKGSGGRLYVPYNAMACLEEKQKRGWSLGPSPVPSFSVSEHAKFDATGLVSPA